MDIATKKPAANKPANPQTRVSTNEMGCFPRCKCMCDGVFCACRENAHKITEPSASDRARGARIGVHS